MLEKIHTAALSGAEDHGRLRASVLRRALATGHRVRTLERQGRLAGGPTRLRHAVADRLVLSKVRDLFGTDLELVLTGAAPIATDVLEFFDACRVLVLEGYGLSETTAAAALNTAVSFRFGTVGRPLPGVEVSIAKDGGILIRGPNVFAGYFKDEQATSEALSEGGWLRSGDLGSFDNDGFLRITGRKKDIIITSGGKSITPANLHRRKTSAVKIAPKKINFRKFHAGMMSPPRGVVFTNKSNADSGGSRGRSQRHRFQPVL